MAQNITAEQAKEWLSGGQAVLVDVREPDEFKEKHIPYAQSIPLSLLQTGDVSLDFPGDQKVIMQCLKGKRGETSCAILEKRDIKNEIYNIEGGIESWIASGLPVVGGARKTGISIFRQVQIVMGSLICLLVVLGMNGFGPGLFLAAIFSAALAIAGVTGWCGLAILLSKMPWNK